MPRYYFHTEFNDEESRDQEGFELSGPEDAWSQASKACGEFILEIDGDMKIGSNWRMTVDDSNGSLFEIRLRSSRLR